MGEAETTHGTGIMASTTTVTVHLNPSQGPECRLVCTRVYTLLTLFFPPTQTLERSSFLLAAFSSRLQLAMLRNIFEALMACTPYIPAPA